MLDISQAANLLTSMGVSSALATRAAERTAQNHSGADPLTFLKELRATPGQQSASKKGPQFQDHKKLSLTYMSLEKDPEL